VDVFGKRFVFVPVVEHLHWSLAVIANLDNLKRHWRAWCRKRRAAAEAAAEAEAAAAAAAAEAAAAAHAEECTMVESEEREAVADVEISDEASTDEEEDGVRLLNDSPDRPPDRLPQLPPQPLPPPQRRRLGQASGSAAAALFDDLAVAGRGSANARAPSTLLRRAPPLSDDGSSSEEEVGATAAAATAAKLASAARVKAAKAANDAAAATDAADADRAPCLVFMDSLNMHAAQQVAANLRAYLKHEWRAKRAKRAAAAKAAAKAAAAPAAKTKKKANDGADGGGGAAAKQCGDEGDVQAKEAVKRNGDDDGSDEDEADNDEAAFEAYVEALFGGPPGSSDGGAQVVPLPLLRPQVPKQANCCDCGVFCVQYAEEVLLRWPAVGDAHVRSGRVAGFSGGMFSTGQMQQKRVAIRQRIDELSG